MTSTVEPRNAADAAKLEAFEHRMNVPILMSAILPIILSFGDVGDPWIAVVMVVTWLVFVADYAVHMRLLRGYARSGRGCFDLGVVFVTAPWFLIPGLGGSQFVALARLARLARIAKVSDGGFRRLIQQLGRVGLYTLLLVVSCAYIAYEVENPVNDEFATLGDSVFWAIVTVTTVGYGDIVPITTVGRLMSVVLMFSGVGLLGVLAGTLASFFGFGGDDAAPTDATPTDAGPSEATPTEASPTEASPTEASPTGAIVDASPSDPDPVVSTRSSAISPESSLTVPNSIDVAALRERLADLEAAVSAVRSQLP